jgi:outer membrane protein TolC
MKNYVKHLNPFRQPTLQEIKNHDLAETEIALHEAQLALERAQANVTMYQNRLQRLKNEHA